MTVLTVTEAKAKFLKVVRDSEEKLTRFVITKEGHPAAVVMNADEFDGWLETMEIMGDKRALKEVRRARRELETGKTKSFAQVIGRAQKK